MTLLKNILWMLCIVLFTSCDVEDNRVVCNYRVQLRYEYNEENTSHGQNMILYYISHIDELIFDEDGILVHIQHIGPDECFEYIGSEITLPPGRYSVIAMGNIDGRSLISDNINNDLIVGVTRRENVRLSLEDAYTFGDGTRGNCEELFHGYRTFTVREEGLSRVRVDMVNDHFELQFRIIWKNVDQRPEAGTYYAILQDIPSENNLMPEYFYPAGSFNAVLHEPTVNDAYPHTDNNVIHHIPRTCYRGHNILSHSNTTYLNADGEVWGKFVNYRIKTATEPVMTLWFAPNGIRSRSTDPMMLPREIKLKDYFSWAGLKLDHELKQEYALDIVVDGDQIFISPFDQFGVSDWTDGGALN